MKKIKWALDPTHSEIQFKIKHLMITTVTGSFKSFTASATTEGEDFSTAKVSFEANTASIDTNNEQRDGHIKGGDFFDVEQHPSISFNSSKIEHGNEAGHYKMHGDLTIKGITKPATMDVEFAGTEKDPWGNQKAGFTVSGKINRKDWDLSWNATLESGGLLLSEDVRVLAEIQMVKQVPAAI